MYRESDEDVGSIRGHFVVQFTILTNLYFLSEQLIIINKVAILPFLLHIHTALFCSSRNIFGHAYKADMQFLEETTQKTKTREQLYCEFPSKSLLHKILEYSFHLESQDKSPFWKEKNRSYKGFEKSSLSLVFLRNFFPKTQKT